MEDEELKAEYAALKWVHQEMKRQFLHMKSQVAKSEEKLENMGGLLVKLHEKERMLVGTINVLVHEWLTPEQRKSLSAGDKPCQEKKKLTLERRNGLNQRTT